MEAHLGAAAMCSARKKSKKLPWAPGALLARDTAAIDEFKLSYVNARQCLPEVCRVVSWIERNEHDAEDLVQDVLLQLLDTRVRRRDGLRTWVRTTVIRMASRRKAADGFRIIREIEHASAQGKSTISNDDYVGWQLSAHLCLLRDPYQAAIRNHFLRGMSYGEMADAASSSESLIRMHISRGLRMLKCRLQQNPH